MLSINHKQIYETNENGVKEWVLIIYDISANHYVGMPVYTNEKDGCLYCKSINKYVDTAKISNYNRSKMVKCIYIQGKPLKLSNKDFGKVLMGCKNELISFLNNNIKDDVDLVREFAKYDYGKKYGIFTSLDKLREDYSIRLISSIALPSVDKIYYINGVHKGYMFELVNEEKGTRLYEVNLFKGGKRYILSVLSNNFNLDMMKEVIGTIKLK